VKTGRDVINTKDTNSNQGEFEYTDKTNFGGSEHWGCGGGKAGACHGMDKMHHEGGTGHSDEGAESCHH
ncbi:MAG: hypothetical protein ABR577_19410, partial [Pyrinomonadaceae bacterium]